MYLAKERHELVLLALWNGIRPGCRSAQLCELLSAHLRNRYQAIPPAAKA